MMIQPEQSLSALPNLVPEDSFCSSGEEGSEEEEVEEWADIDLDLNLWHLDLEEVANWGIGEVGVHAMETECHQQAPKKNKYHRKVFRCYELFFRCLLLFFRCLLASGRLLTSVLNDP